jgi:hypothetical protein
VIEVFGDYSVLPATCRNSAFNKSRQFSSNSLFTNHPIIRRYIIPPNESVMRFEPGTTRVSGRNAKHFTATIISHTKYTVLTSAPIGLHVHTIRLSNISTTWWIFSENKMGDFYKSKELSSSFYSGGILIVEVFSPLSA